jgi:hypothetical protein
VVDANGVQRFINLVDDFLAMPKNENTIAASSGAGRYGGEKNRLAAACRRLIAHASRAIAKCLPDASNIGLLIRSQRHCSLAKKNGRPICSGAQQSNERLLLRQHGATFAHAVEPTRIFAHLILLGNMWTHVQHAGGGRGARRKVREVLVPSTFYGGSGAPD